MTLEREPSIGRVFQDALRVLFLALICVPVAFIFLRLRPTSPEWLDWAIRTAAALTTELLAISILREIIPRPLGGAYIAGMNARYIRWLVSAAFVEVAMSPLVRGPFWFLHSTRVLYLTALGGKISWSVGVHGEVILRDPSLVMIGHGALLEAGVTIEAALHGAGRVRIAPVVIGGGCLLGAHSILMPGATLGHDARVAPGAFIGEDAHIGVGATIAEGARIERGVDVGSYSSVGIGAILSEGVRVGDRARIAPGAVVPAHTEVREREVWQGQPAQRVSDAW